MRINLNDMLYALSYALDCVEHDVVGVTTNHGKRVAYVTATLAKETGMTTQEQLELAGAAILHDNALTEYVYELQGETPSGAPVKVTANTDVAQIGRHCTMGEKNIAYIPFRTNLKDSILYHHENADGTGPFGKMAAETPMTAQIIHIADQMDAKWSMNHVDAEKFAAICDWVHENENILFSPDCVRAFDNGITLSLLQKLNMSEIDALLYGMLPEETPEYTDEEMIRLAKLFAKIVDYKSEFTRRHSLGIARKAKTMAEYYGYAPEKTTALYLAGALHDIGKLVVSNDILEKPDRLTDEEFGQIQNHAVATYRVLCHINGLEVVTEWASNHHEKLDGSGYPLGKTAEALSFEDRLLCCLDIYQALTEKRPYKDGFSHEKAISILTEMVEKHQLDGEIVADIDKVFSAASAEPFAEDSIFAEKKAEE